MTKEEKRVLVGALINIVGPRAEKGEVADDDVYDLVEQVLDTYDSDWRYEDEREELQNLYDDVIELILSRGYNIDCGKVRKMRKEEMG